MTDVFCKWILICRRKIWYRRPSLCRLCDGHLDCWVCQHDRCLKSIACSVFIVLYLREIWVCWVQRGIRKALCTFSSETNVYLTQTSPKSYPRLAVDSSWNVMAHGDAREGKWRGNWRMEWVASTLHPTSEHCVSSITTADAHTSAASSRLNWRPPADLNGLVRCAQKNKSGFCVCAITFQLASTRNSEYFSTFVRWAVGRNCVCLDL